MKIAVVGAGGVGGTFGVRLAAAGNEVVFVARGAHRAAMRDHGLRLSSPLGDAIVERPQIADSLADVAEAELVLLAVKLWDTEALLEPLQRLARRGAAVMSLQNGVQKDEMLTGALPAGSVLGGVCYISAHIAEPGHVRHANRMQRIVFGEYAGDRTARVEAIEAALQAAGIEVEVSSDIRRVIWQKFVFLTGLSATTATMRVPIGIVRADPQARGFLHDVMREAVAVGRAEGVALTPEAADDALAFCDGLAPDMIASMLHDLENGARLESPWLSGAVADLGERHGVATPCNRAVRDILSVRAQGAPRLPEAPPGG